MKLKKEIWGEDWVAVLGSINITCLWWERTGKRGSSLWSRVAHDLLEVDAPKEEEEVWKKRNMATTVIGVEFGPTGVIDPDWEKFLKTLASTNVLLGK